MEVNISPKQKPFNGIRIAAKDTDLSDSFDTEPTDPLNVKDSDAELMDDYAMIANDSEDYSEEDTSEELFRTQ